MGKDRTTQYYCVQRPRETYRITIQTKYDTISWIRPLVFGFKRIHRKGTLFSFAICTPQQLTRLEKVSAVSLCRISPSHSWWKMNNRHFFNEQLFIPFRLLVSSHQLLVHIDNAHIAIVQCSVNTIQLQCYSNIRNNEGKKTHLQAFSVRIRVQTKILCFTIPGKFCRHAHSFHSVDPMWIPIVRCSDVDCRMTHGNHISL